MKNFISLFFTLSIYCFSFAQSGNTLAQQWLSENAVSINSTNTDYQDLEFLIPLLKNKKIVQLGESGHGMAEFITERTRLVQFLHEKLDFDVVVFEGGLTECSCLTADQEKNNSAKTFINNCLHRTYRYKDFVPLVEYAQKNNMSLAGFDMSKTSSAFLEAITSLIKAIDPSYATKVEAMEKNFLPLLWGQIKKEQYDSVYQETITAYRDFGLFIKNNKKTMSSHLGKNPNQKLQFIQQGIKYRVQSLKTGLKVETMNQYYGMRDMIMAENLIWLSEIAFPNKKMIVLTHNIHIQKASSDTEAILGGKTVQYKGMGEYLHNALGEKIYTIGLYAFEGKHWGFWDNTIYDIGKHPENSLEVLFASLKKDVLFLDLSMVNTISKNNEWLFQPINTQQGGRLLRVVTLKDNYDGVLFVRKVSPTELLEK